MTFVSDILISLSATTVLVFVDALILWLVIDKILKYSEKWNKGFKTTLEIAAIAGLVSFVLSVIIAVLGVLPYFWGKSLIGWIFLVIPLGVMLWLIKRTYHLEWGKAVIAWLVFIFGEVALGILLGGLINLTI